METQNAASPLNTEAHFAISRGGLPNVTNSARFERVQRHPRVGASK